MKKAARGSRKRSKLWTHAVLGHERIPEALGTAGGQADRPATRKMCRYNTTFMASLDVKTALDVPKPSVVSKIPTSTRVHGHQTAALLAEMQDVRGSACFENSKTEFRYSRCIRQGCVEAPVPWGRVAQNVLWKAEEKWEGQRLGVILWRTA